MDLEDPFNWDVDRIVRELCTQPRAWRVTAASRRLPNPVIFEEALRREEIDGFTLLTAVTEEGLKNELGLQALGQRAAVAQFIRDLRQLSPQYQVWVKSFGSDVSLAAHNCLVDSTTKKRPRSPTLINFKPEEDDGTGVARGNWIADAARKKRRRVEDITSDLTYNAFDLSDPVDRGQDPWIPDSETIVAMTDGHDGQLADLGATIEVTKPIADDKITGELKSPVKKVKRVQPTLLTSTVDAARYRDIPTQADVVTNNEHDIQPGIIYDDQARKKRLMLVSRLDNNDELPQSRRARSHNKAGWEKNRLRTGGQRGLEAAHQIFVAPNGKADREHEDNLSDGYLGKKMHAVDEIFYPDASMGNELPMMEEEEETSWQVMNGISSGRRLYINSMMKHYLRSKWQTVHRGSKVFFARVPYATRVAPMHFSPSFTLIKAKNGSFSATREKLVNWPELSSSPNITAETLPSIDDQRQVQFKLPDNLPLGGPSSYDNWDPDVLEKYRYIDGGDVVLPLYGESDEDGEYDIETWNEIEEEHGTLEKPILAIKTRLLTQEEVNAAMDEAIARMLIQWNMDKLPKRQSRAWSLWRKGRCQETKRLLIQEAQQHVNRISNERIPQMRNKILEEVWTSQKKVRWQTKIMQQSLFDREDLIWQISVLESAVEPEKPLSRVAQKPKRRKTNDDEDGENIETTELEDSYDELDDFVVDDDDLLAGEGDNLYVSYEAEEPNHKLSSSRKASTDIYVQKSMPDAKLEIALVPDLVNKEPSGMVKLSPKRILVGSKKDDIKYHSPNGIRSTPPQLSLRPAVDEKIQPKLPPLKQRETGLQRTSDIIDLTQLNFDVSGVELSPSTPHIIDLVTPNKRKNNLKITYKGKCQPVDEKLTIRISDSEDAVVAPKALPHVDLAAIAKMSPEKLEKAGDSDILLIWMLQAIARDPRAELYSLFKDLQAPQMWSPLVEVLHSLRDGFRDVEGMDQQIYTSLTGVIQLFQLYVDCLRYDRCRLTAEMVAKLKDNERDFGRFHKICLDTLNTLFATDSDSDSLPIIIWSPKSNLIQLSDCDSEDDTPRRLRKKKVHEDLQARDLREQDQRRIVEQNGRRRMLRQKLALFGDINASGARIIVNDAKLDHHGFVYIHGEIQKRIKDHQIEGIRFMWSQIVTNNPMHGCLLAHTMGLGKTMQVITLLAAIAEAAQSPEESIASQIPESLCRSQTLVLCPPTLIDNWVDELLTWTPLNDDGESVLGKYLKISSTMALDDRLRAIDEWHRSSGVLIIGYEMFRTLIANSLGENKGPLLRNEDHERVLEQLLDGPSIIVADEAHRMKNPSSGITKAASRFTSRSRIALTGSPLANNVEEYHTMIEWVAPNYLGPIAEFRAKYVEPIERGLWMESSSWERRKSLKMLGVLKEDLAPKVHRADMTVLRGDLKPKTEFVITVPLTPLQKRAYSLYVRSMLGMDNDLTKGGQIQTRTLWHWLAVLSLLCNHPECFREKLQISWNDAHKPPDAKFTEDGEQLWKAGVSEELFRREMELFKSFGSPIDAVDNSNKVKILERILDASKAAGDKVLVFTQSIPTLDFLEGLCKKKGRSYARLDGQTKMNTRQAATKDFNASKTELFLISTRAGGLGLNLPGANRVVIFDFKFNPINEEQAIGRAYRIGQQKPVFVYKFVAGGTFEDCVHNSAVFKIQLASRVVDKKNYVASAKRNIGDFLFEPKDVKQQDLSPFKGKDPLVLDKLLDFQDVTICGIVITDSFQRDDNDELTIEEQNEVRQLLSEEQLKRLDPVAYRKKLQRREQDLQKAALAASTQPTPDQVASMWSSSSQQANATKLGQYQPPTKPTNSFVSSTSKKEFSPHQSPEAVPDMPPIAATNTKVRSSANSINVTPSDSLAEGAASNQSDSRPRPKNVSSQSDTASTHKRDLHPCSPKDILPQGPHVPIPSENADRKLRAAIKQAIEMSKANGGFLKFSEQRIQAVIISLRSIISRNSPGKFSEIAQRLKSEPSLLIQLLLGELGPDDIVERTMNQSSKHHQILSPWESLTSSTPKQTQGPKGFEEASTNANSPNQFLNSIQPLTPPQKSSADPGNASSATKYLLVSSSNQLASAQKFEAVIQATLAANKPDNSSVTPTFSREFCADISRAISLGMALRVRDVSQFEAATTAAIREMSKYDVLSDILKAPNKGLNFAERMVRQSKAHPASSSNASSDAHPKPPIHLPLSFLSTSRSRNTTSGVHQRQQTEVDWEHFKKIAAHRLSNASDMTKQRDQDNPPISTQSRDSRLPKWAISRIEAGGSRRTSSSRN